MKHFLTRTVALFGFVVASFAETPQSTFEFHSGFWVNLHHTLYNHVVLKKAGIARNLSALSAAELASWDECVKYYEENVARPLLDLPMIRINSALSELGNGGSLKTAALPAALIPILEQAAQIYRAHWWTDHDRKNHVTISSWTPRNEGPRRSRRFSTRRVMRWWITSGRKFGQRKRGAAASWSIRTCGTW